MADKVTLYHPALRNTVTVPRASAEVLKKSGWTEDAPRPTRRPRRPKNESEEN